MCGKRRNAARLWYAKSFEILFSSPIPSAFPPAIASECVSGSSLLTPLSSLWRLPKRTLSCGTTVTHVQAGRML